jgi:hypothetical protein
MGYGPRKEWFAYARMFKNVATTNRMAMPIENLKRNSSPPRRLWNDELKLSPPNAPPKLEPRCCSKIAVTSRMERIIWIYGSAGSTESIIFMPRDNTRKPAHWQAREMHRKSPATDQVYGVELPRGAPLMWGVYGSRAS